MDDCLSKFKEIGPLTRVEMLAGAGTFWYCVFERTGALRDLERAIRSQQRAVLLAAQARREKPAHFDSLGNFFQSRFLRTRMLSDIEEAIKSRQRAVSLARDGPDKTLYLNNLGCSFQNRFRHTWMLSDIEEAIKNHQQAVLLTPDGHPDKPRRLNNLGCSFEGRFRCSRMLSDLEEAIKYEQQAVSLTANSHNNKPKYLNNLGFLFSERFQCTGMLSDIDEAIKNQHHAVSLTPNYDVNKPLRLKNLGHSCQVRFQRTGVPNDLKDAISNFRLAATSNSRQVLARCYVFQLWARLEAKHDPPSALAAYRQAIKFFPQVAWIGDPIATRYSQLTDFGDLPREAAAFALDAGYPDLALEWLEQGRSVVWNQLLHLRTSVHHLRQAHPKLCAKFAQISHELRSAATRGHTVDASGTVDNPVTLEEETQRHHRLAEKWDSLVKKIRSLPNFQDFLLPSKISVLKEAASSGPVVVINVHRSRCDALILNRNTDHVLHIPLDKLSYTDVVNMWKSLKEDLVGRGYRGSGIAGESSRLTGILSKLYLHVVDPILKGLNFTTGAGSNPSSLPRIWWCPTGPLTFLPLHAACHKIGATVVGTFTHAISSYTPTVTALLEARAVKQQPFNQIIGIAMTDTPDYDFLPSAETEMANIAKLFSDDAKHNFEVLRNEQATGEQVLMRMTSSSWIHLACHAIQDKQESTRSGFCLHDRRLTIMDIIAKPFAQADLAFLSACETATGDAKVSDEALHITGAMLGAGYRNVIGTMWAIPDEAAPGIAAKVYEVLLSGGEPNSDRAAQALHEAVKEVRELDHDSFHFWVPFVHYGA